MAEENLWSKLRSLFGKSSRSNGGNQELDMDFDEARPQHYHFVHRFLPGQLEFGAKTVVERLLENPGRYLNYYWSSSMEEIGIDQQKSLPSDGLECFPIQLDDTRHGVLIQLPEPKNTNEAYFAAIVITKSSENFDEFRYFTLEYSKGFDGFLRTVLCEWKDGTHFNYGDGPPPQSAAFIESLKRLL